MKCLNCGSNLPDGSTYCENCKSVIGYTTQNYINSEQIKDGLKYKVGKESKESIIISIILLILIAFVFDIKFAIVCAIIRFAYSCIRTKDLGATAFLLTIVTNIFLFDSIKQIVTAPAFEINVAFVLSVLLCEIMIFLPNLLISFLMSLLVRICNNIVYIILAFVFVFIFCLIAAFQAGFISVTVVTLIKTFASIF